MEFVALALLVLAGSLVVAALLLRGRHPGGAGIPVHAQLVELRQRLDQLVDTQTDLVVATRQLEEVGSTVGELRRILEAPQLRGAVGEVWLEELLRQVLPASLYEMQHGFRSGVRVDVVIRVGDRLVPVDAKFPLEAWRRVLQLEGEAAVRERRAFRRVLAQRVDEIAAKYIRPDEGTTDFALMYVPAEGVYYDALLREEPTAGAETLLGYARSQRVLIVSPNTFYAYLSALAYGLRGRAIEPRARELLDALAGLRQDVQRYADGLDTLGRHLGHASKQFAEVERASYRVQDRLDGLNRMRGEVPDA
ncbi:MAG: DNA recombination protein RmuC [Gemmatimonadota bacterium]|nr:DNA recombination protein RmuC [Gemmatimonadota bacterium]